MFITTVASDLGRILPMHFAVMYRAWQEVGASMAICQLKTDAYGPMLCIWSSCCVEGEKYSPVVLCSQFSHLKFIWIASGIVETHRNERISHMCGH